MPERIQRRRTAGWRMPDGVVFVGRPTRWGNPYRVGVRWQGYPAARDHADAVALYVRMVEADNAAAFQAEVRRALAGRDLACWCPLDRPCHADVLLRIATGKDPL